MPMNSCVECYQHNFSFSLPSAETGHPNETGSTGKETMLNVKYCVKTALTSGFLLLLSYTVIVVSQIDLEMVGYLS